MSFGVHPGVKLRGGFEGTETSSAERDPDRNVTILSGDIDDNDANAGGTEIDDSWSDIRGVNTYNIMWLRGSSDPDTREIDGFTITGGDAQGAAFPANVGAGLYCNGEGSVCSPVLSNLRFIGNRAVEGGAIYADGWGTGNSSPAVSDSQFIANNAKNGGAVFCNSELSGNSSPTFTRVRFQQNAAVIGGALQLNILNGGTSSSVFVDVLFDSNSADATGGAIYALESSGWNSPTIKNSTFVKNSTALEGGAIYGENSGASSNWEIANSTFTSNLVTGGFGGAAEFVSYGTGSENITVNNSTFSLNVVRASGQVDDGYGGAISTVLDDSRGASASMSIRNSVFWADQADTAHNEIDNYNVSLTMEDSISSEGCPSGATCANISSSDPKLEPLAYHFGFTPVMRPGIFDSAVNTGNDLTCEKTDQRGFARPQGAHCDIGAVEFRFPSDDVIYADGF